MSRGFALMEKVSLLSVFNSGSIVVADGSNCNDERAVVGGEGDRGAINISEESIPIGINILFLFFYFFFLL
jgi:hypothetical protein